MNKKVLLIAAALLFSAGQLSAKNQKCTMYNHNEASASSVSPESTTNSIMLKESVPPATQKKKHRIHHYYANDDKTIRVIIYTTSRKECRKIEAYVLDYKTRDTLKYASIETEYKFNDNDFSFNDVCYVDGVFYCYSKYKYKIWVFDFKDNAKTCEPYTIQFPHYSDSKIVFTEKGFYSVNITTVGFKLNIINFDLSSRKTTSRNYIIDDSTCNRLKDIEYKLSKDRLESYFKKGMFGEAQVFPWSGTAGGTYKWNFSDPFQLSNGTNFIIISRSASVNYESKYKKKEKVLDLGASVPREVEVMKYRHDSTLYYDHDQLICFFNTESDTCKPVFVPFGYRVSKDKEPESYNYVADDKVYLEDGTKTYIVSPDGKIEIVNRSMTKEIKNKQKTATKKCWKINLYEKFWKERND